MSLKIAAVREENSMGVNSRELDESGYALCGCCRKKFFLRDLEDQCEFCGKWFCKSCSKPVPAGHGYGKICKRCYTKIKNEDRKR